MQERLSRNKEIGRRIRTYREAAGVKVIDVAQAMGVSRQFYYDLELGKKGLTALRLEEIARILQVDMYVLLTGRERQPPPLPPAPVRVSQP